MSVADDFLRFRAAYNVSAATAAIISARYQRITGQLNWDFWGVSSNTRNSLYVGSYGRDTAASGVSDIDVGFLLPSNLYGQYNGHAGNGQSSLLQAVRNSIQRTYPTTAVSGDGQVVKTTFADGTHFEVLPVFDNVGGTWTYPDSNGGGSWKTCNPRAEMAAMTALNSQSNKNLKLLCRMMRKWKDYWSVPISGILLDALAYSFMAGWGYRDKSFGFHDWMVRDFLLYLANQPSTQSYWKAPGSGSFVYRTGHFETKARTCYNLAAQAVAYDVAGQTWSRRQKWREVFGPSYPAA